MLAPVRGLVLLVVVIAGLPAYEQENKPGLAAPNYFVVNQTTMAFYTRQSCVAVLPDGRYKFERVIRRSAKDRPRSVEEYFGKLDQKSFNDILELSAVRTLPEVNASGRYECFDPNYHGDRWFMDLYEDRRHVRVRFPNPRSNRPSGVFQSWFHDLERDIKVWSKADKSSVCVPPLAESPAVSAKDLHCPPK